MQNRFPIFKKHPALVYLDNAATTQRPDLVIESLDNFNRSENANSHRGIYSLSNKATQQFENSRTSTAKFLNTDKENIAFTTGTTESINFVANGFLKSRLKDDENVVSTILEHHSNFVPWQMCCQQVGAEFRLIDSDAQQPLNASLVINSLDSKTRMIAIQHISNTLGTVNEISEIIEAARSRNIPILIDAAQSAALYQLDVNELDCDFLVFSAHKAFGPFGVGILYAHDRVKDDIQPTNYGGGMVKEVSTKETSFKSFPYSLDAGTSNVAGIIGWSSAIKFLNALDKDSERKKIKTLTDYTITEFSKINDLEVIGNPQAGIISFTVKDIHPHDIATELNEDNIAVRAGMHCTQPLMDRLKLNGTTRVSFSIYNTKEDVDKLLGSLQTAIKFLR